MRIALKNFHTDAPTIEVVEGGRGDWSLNEGMSGVFHYVLDGWDGESRNTIILAPTQSSLHAVLVKTCVDNDIQVQAFDRSYQPNKKGKGTGKRFSSYSDFMENAEAELEEWLNTALAHD